jgi:hypothetical protein
MGFSAYYLWDAAHRASHWLGGGAAFAAVLTCSAQGFELPPVQRASEILTPELLSSEHHEVEERVDSDGFMNHYVIDTRFGRMEAYSTAELRIRVREIGAMNLMYEARATEVFQQAAVRSVKDVRDAAVGALTNPVGTVSGALSGVGSMFRRGADSLFGDPPADTDDSRLRSLLGFYSRKREYAAYFGVDPYSSNEKMHKLLDELTWVSWSGGLGVSVLMSTVPGAAGTGVSAVRRTDSMYQAYSTKTPADLRRLNKERLLGLGLDEKVVDLFIHSTVWTPSERTRFVRALDEMNDVGGLEELVNMAVLTTTDDAGRFRRIQAQMYARLNAGAKPIKTFVPVGELPAAKLEDGSLLLIVPTDYVAWTAPAEALSIQLAHEAKTVQGAEAKQIWFGGRVTPLTRKQLEEKGWTLRDEVEAKLVGN